MIEENIFAEGILTGFLAAIELFINSFIVVINSVF